MGTLKQNLKMIGKTLFTAALCASATNAIRILSQQQSETVTDTDPSMGSGLTQEDLAAMRGEAVTDTAMELTPEDLAAMRGEKVSDFQSEQLPEMSKTYK